MSSPRSHPAQGAAKRQSTLMLVHTSSRDIDMYHYLRKLRTGKCKSLFTLVINNIVEVQSGLRADPISRLAHLDEKQPVHFVFPPPPLPWSPGNPDSNTLELVDYCKLGDPQMCSAVWSLLLTFFSCSCQCVLLHAVRFGGRCRSSAKCSASYDCF